MTTGKRPRPPGHGALAMGGRVLAGFSDGGSPLAGGFGGPGSDVGGLRRTDCAPTPVAMRGLDGCGVRRVGGNRDTTDGGTP